MKVLYHPHIVKVLEIIESKEYTAIIMENASGGELHDYVTSKKGLDEAEARRFFRQILSAVEYCHEVSLAFYIIYGSCCILHIVFDRAQLFIEI
jgi:serine/threonine protein kinase